MENIINFNEELYKKRLNELKNISDEDKFKLIIKAIFNNRISLVYSSLNDREKKHSETKLRTNLRGLTFSEYVDNCKKYISGAKKLYRNCKFSSEREMIEAIITDLNGKLNDRNTFNEILKSDNYLTILHEDIMYPIIEKLIFNQYYEQYMNKTKSNVELGRAMNKSIDRYLIISSLLNIMYTKNFVASKEKADIYFEHPAFKEIYPIIKENGITVGMIRDSITNLKFDIRRDVINKIEDEKLRKNRLRGIEDALELNLRRNKEEADYNYGIFERMELERDGIDSDTKLIADMCIKQNKKTL